MPTATTMLRSLSPYSQSRYHISPKLENESPQAYEERTWRERCHYLPDTGQIFIPPMQFKNALSEAAQYRPIHFKGNRTYTKFFSSGVLVVDGLALPHKKDAIDGEWLSMSSTGKKGGYGGSRVPRCYPVIPSWEGEVVWHILDSTITKGVFEKTLVTAGQFIGIGRFRPERGGFKGRFEIVSLTWED